MGPGGPALGHTSTIEGHKGSITALRYASKGGMDWMLSGSEDGKARLWDLERKKSVRCFLPSEGADDAEISSVCHGQDETAELVAMSYNTTVAVFDVRDPAMVTRKAAFAFALHQDEVNEVEIASFDGRAHMAAADDNGEVVVYDLKGGKLLRRLSQAHENICASLSFRQGHAWQLVTAGLDGKVVHWNYNKVRALATFHTANMSPKGAAGASAGRTQLVNPRLPYAVAAHPSGHHVAVALGDGSVAVYDLASKKLVQEWEAGDNMINAVEWAPFASPDSPIVVSAGTDGFVSVTDVTGAAVESIQMLEFTHALAALEGGDEQFRINSVACTPSGRVYVGDQGQAILEFDLRNPHLPTGKDARLR